MKKKDKNDKLYALVIEPNPDRRKDGKDWSDGIVNMTELDKDGVWHCGLNLITSIEDVVEHAYKRNVPIITRKFIEKKLDHIICLGRALGCRQMINNGQGDISYHDWNTKYSDGCWCKKNKMKPKKLLTIGELLIDFGDEVRGDGGFISDQELGELVSKYEKKVNKKIKEKHG